MDIRHKQFNVYYGGGNLMTAKWKRSGWSFGFDQNYFDLSKARAEHAKNPGQPLPVRIPLKSALPQRLGAPSDALTWADSFDGLMSLMDEWWKRHPKTERADCQDIARINHAGTANPKTDFAVVDIEYQWALRRFDMVAVRRMPTADDPSGWSQPGLVFVEVKSEIGACTGKAGLADHARDFADIVTARGGAYIQDIQDEFTTLIRQKQALGLINSDFPFQRFKPGQPELMFVTVNLDLMTPSRKSLWNPVHQTAREIALPGFQLIQLQRHDLSMMKGKILWV